MGWENYALVFALSMLPLFEGRYAIVTARVLGLDPFLSLLFIMAGVSVIGIALPRVLPLADTVAMLLSRRRTPILSRLASSYLHYAGRARERARRLVERYGLWGLIIFVAIPLPATGVWTGAIAAHLLGMDRGRMTIGLLVGGWISVIIMGALSWGLF